MKVRCPYCKTIKTIDKTDKNIQVRCSKREGGCGERFYVKENIVLEKETFDKKDETNKTIKIPKIEFNGMVGDLIIALSWAINTIKNKPEVKKKVKFSTYFQYYTRWSRYRNYFQALEEEKR